MSYAGYACLMESALALTLTGFALQINSVQETEKKKKKKKHNGMNKSWPWSDDFNFEGDTKNTSYIHGCPTDAVSGMWIWL